MVKDIAKEINDSLKNSDVYTRYVICKKNIENNSELIYLRSKLKELKDKNCKLKDEALINEYYDLEKEYKNNILVKEYECAKEEMHSLLCDIGDILTFK